MSALAITTPNHVAPNWDEIRTLFERVIAGGKATKQQVDMVVMICQRYGLDPILKHVVIVSNNLYVTRDGLLHIAHQSGQFDGMQVSIERETVGNKTFFIATCTVWRKDMAHPFTYSSHQQEAEQANNNAWKSYPRAMTIKAAEVATLRRAFSVALGAAEEIGYDAATSTTSLGPALYVDATHIDVAEPTPDRTDVIVNRIHEMDAEGFAYPKIVEYARSRYNDGDPELIKAAVREVKARRLATAAQEGDYQPTPRDDGQPILAETPEARIAMLQDIRAEAKRCTWDDKGLADHCHMQYGTELELLTIEQAQTLLTYLRSLDGAPF